MLCRSTEMAFRGQIPFEHRNVDSGDDVPASWISDVSDIKYDAAFRPAGASFLNDLRALAS